MTEVEGRGEDLAARDSVAGAGGAVSADAGASAAAAACAVVAECSSNGRSAGGRSAQGASSARAARFFLPGGVGRSSKTAEENRVRCGKRDMGGRALPLTTTAHSLMRDCSSRA
jgi:hypothetical protein